MEQTWCDVRYGVRQLRRNPGYAAVAIVSLMLGIAANTAIFSLINGLLLRPLPGKSPGELVTVYTSDSSGPLCGASSYPDFIDFSQKNEVFSGLAACAMESLLLTPPGGNDSARVLGHIVSGKCFEVLGMAAATGRTFRAEEDSREAEPVAVPAYAVSRRTQELGLRMALGARRGDILRMVLRQGMTLTLAGTVLGLAASAGLTRFAGFLLYGISPLDPWTFLAIPVLLTVVALAAGMVPALRSTRISPVDALRYQ